MWLQTENCWKRSSVFYFFPTLYYYSDSGFIKEKTLTLAWLFWQVEVGSTIDYH